MPHRRGIYAATQQLVKLEVLEITMPMFTIKPCTQVLTTEPILTASGSGLAALG
ncbi:MAG: hypothetical protein ACRYF0_04640 [Janthinobacterium lividum]